MKSYVFKVYLLVWSFLEFTRTSIFLWSILAYFSSPVIICYHRISKNKLEYQLRFIKSLFNILPLNNLLDNVYENSNLNNSKQLAVTMDDCYRSDFLTATKVFTKLNIPCTFFIPTGYSNNQKTLWGKKLINLFKFIDSSIINESKETIFFKNPEDKNLYFDFLMNKYLWNNTPTAVIETEVDKICELNNFKISNDDIVISSNEIKKYSKYDLFDFQSHTISHPKLILCSQEELIKEFEDSKKYLKTNSNNSQNIICYPYGSFWHIGSSFKIAQDFYKYGLSLETGSVRSNKPKMIIPRIGLYEKDSSATIFAKILLAQFK